MGVTARERPIANRPQVANLPHKKSSRRAKRQTDSRIWHAATKCLGIMRKLQWALRFLIPFLLLSLTSFVRAQQQPAPPPPQTAAPTAETVVVTGTYEPMTL